jgi:hypothetical protein
MKSTSLAAIALLLISFSLHPQETLIMARISLTPRSSFWNRAIKFAAIGSIVLIAGATMLAGRQGVVTTIDGRNFEGEITERGGEVVIRVKGIESTLNRDDIAAIVYGTFVERFEKALAALKPDDVAGRVALGRDALGRGAYDQANKAAGAALDIDPLDRPARDLMSAIEQQQRAASAAVTPKTPATPEAETPREKPADLISEELINTIRQSELRAEDSRVRIRFANNVRKRYVDSQANLTYGEFIKQSETEQALEMLRNGKKELVPDIIVATDPPMLLEYNRRVQTVVLQGCATSQCHGGGSKGSMPLVSPARSTEESMINFHTLVTYQASVGEKTDTGGIFSGPAARKLIDRESPDRSLLLEFGLPKNRTQSPHPEVKGYNGIFRDSNDPQYKLILNWINELKKPSPNYEMSKPSTQPAK